MSINEFSGSHQPLQAEAPRAISDSQYDRFLPSLYDPYVRRYHRLVQEVRELEERTLMQERPYRHYARIIGGSTLFKNISPLFGYFWLSWGRAHGATMFLVDLALIIYTLILVSESQDVNPHKLSTTQIAAWIGVPFYSQLAFPLMTWSFGYIGPRESTYIGHTAVAGIRVVFCLACFFQVYFRTDFGLLYSIAVKLMSVLFLASLAHLTGASIRTAQFLRERAHALRNPSDRRVHPGNGFTFSYLSPEDQEKQKAAARGRVSTHDSYVETVGAYWHCPTPELDVQHDVYTGTYESTQEIQWWYKLWAPRTRLQRHVKRVAYMRQWPLNFPTPELPHNDLFAHCDCCLDDDKLPEALPSRLSYKTRVQHRSLAQMQHRRKLFLARVIKVPALPDQQRPLSDDAERQREEYRDCMMPEAPLLSLHQLCERCESLCCESKMLALLAGSEMLRFWRHVRATFTFTHMGPLLEEMFLLWESAVALRASAFNGCHLCSMLWNSLSPVQQTALVREVNAYSGTYIPKDLSVFVKILSPHGWQPGRQSGEDSFQHLYLVTHFGPRRVPRFWMEQKFVLRAQSLGRDPMLENSELLPPIRICLTDPSDLAIFAPPSSSPSTDSLTAMNFVKYWLAAHQHSLLMEDHTHLPCEPAPASNSAKEQTFTRPKRLLEILQDQTVRLVCDLPLTFKASYVALSYCWHSTHNCILEAESLALYMDGVDVHGLPPTIQDALRVTQTLGFSHVWIDALCIVQDSEDDKIEQLMNMRSIYAGAAFVIAAAAAVDSSQGFLVDQMPYAMSACFLDTSRDPSKTGSYRFPSTYKALMALPCQKLATAADYELSLSRLKSRGWVYQEEELAARVVYFCDRQLVLRCNLCRRTAFQQYLPPAPASKILNTMWPSLMPMASGVTSALRALRAIMRTRGHRSLQYDKSIARSWVTNISGQLSSMEGHRTVIEGAILHSTQQERWWTQVEEYSSRHLSYGADKLPAIQGLADRFHSELLASQDRDTHPEPVRYVVGLWSGDAFVMGLLWYVKDGITIRPEFRAPSWTWAAVDGVIGHNSLSGHAHVDACGVSVLKIPDSHDHRLVLKALMKPATWHRAPDDRKMSYVGHRRHGTVRFQHDLAEYEPLTIDLTQGPDTQLLRDLSGLDIGYLVLDSESELPTEGSEVYCLRIVVKPATHKEEHDFNVPWATRGLALIKDREDASTFRRIGYIELQRTPGGISYPSSMNPSKQKAERNPPPNIDVVGFFDDCAFTTVTLI